MKECLTNSPPDRQEILDTEEVLQYLHDNIAKLGTQYQGDFYLTLEDAASYFGVNVAVIQDYTVRYQDELSQNGFTVFRGESLADFLTVSRNISSTQELPVFTFKAFLDLAFLLPDNEKASRLRCVALIVMTDVINLGIGGGAIYLQNDCEPSLPHTDVPENSIEYIMIKNQDVLKRLHYR